MSALKEAAQAVVERHHHAHTDGCYGPYQVCGEHHRQTPTCGARLLYCRRSESDETVNRLHAALQQKGLDRG